MHVLEPEWVESGQVGSAKCSGHSPPSAEKSHRSSILQHPYFSSICGSNLSVVASHSLKSPLPKTDQHGHKDASFLQIYRSTCRFLELAHAGFNRKKAVRSRQGKEALYTPFSSSFMVNYCLYFMGMFTMRAITQGSGLSCKKFPVTWQAMTRKRSMLERTCVKDWCRNHEVNQRYGCARISGPHRAPHTIR